MRVSTIIRNQGALCIAAVLAAGLLHCGDLSLSEGGFGSETTNGIIMGTVVMPDGAPVAYAPVSVRRTDYVNSNLPKGQKAKTRTGADALTDTNGMFRVDSLDTGRYTVMIRDESDNAVMSECVVAPGLQKIDLEDEVLRPCVTVLGWVDPELLAGRAYVQVFGSDKVVPVDSSGCFSVSGMPAGTLNFRVSGTGTTESLLLEPVTVSPGDTVSVPPRGWRYSRRLYLNTTASGAGVYGTVCRFPLLVRLTGDNFDFSEARDGGGDVKFTKSNGMPMPFEIERWDPSLGMAELWVLIDTVYGNDSSRHFLMYWGNSEASARSDGTVVFDTAQGYLGVWHCGGSVEDATGRANNASSCSALDSPGIVGMGKKFGGADSIRIDGLLGRPSTVTLSAWSRLDTLNVNGSGAEVVSIGNACLLRMDDIRSNHGAMGAFHQAGDSVFYNVYSGQYLKKTGWHCLAFVVDAVNSTQALYVDGVLSSLHNSKEPVNYSGTGQHTFIGRHGNGKIAYFFRGMIDEVRISAATRSADWIRLEFMNQNASNVLVVER
ncbi:MAG: DUF2341 domain-containing protein [Chitinispirillaceae bacterium]|nr:DUF2341 domain-containing protein [Chitinispirillaceae bacterium]